MEENVILSTSARKYSLLSLPNTEVSLGSYFQTMTCYTFLRLYFVLSRL